MFVQQIPKEIINKDAATRPALWVSTSDAATRID
jgi:hypothetical protein